MNYEIIDGNTVWPEEGHVWEGHKDADIVCAFRPELQHIAKGDKIWGDVEYVEFGIEPLTILDMEDNRRKWMEASLRMPTGKLAFINYGKFDEDGNFVVVDTSEPEGPAPEEVTAE